MRLLPAHIITARSRFVTAVRRFFEDRDVLEVETPLWNRHGAVETHLDSLTVHRRGVRKSAEAESLDAGVAGYLITSPEYNMKILLSELRRSIFQIAHSFREGDAGSHHSEEFLMLEWYLVDADEFGLMDQCAELLRWLGNQPFARADLPSLVGSFPRHSVGELLERHAGCRSCARADIIAALERHGLLAAGEDPETQPYEDLFFALFLNRVEAHLGVDRPEFVYDYPPELAALSRVEDGRARRFELYWQRIELANGYYELTDPAEQRARFAEDNARRLARGKPNMVPDPAFLAALDRGLPRCSGVALGLDRLFMLLQGAAQLAEISPFESHVHATDQTGNAH